MTTTTTVASTTTTTAPACPACGASASFGLGRANGFAVLALAQADVRFGGPSTMITGNVGLGPLDTGALEKATIDGKLILDPTETATIHPDLIATCGTVTQDLSGADTDARAASAFLAAKVPTQTFTTITTSTTITGTAGENVIDVTTIDLQNQNLTLSGSATSTFILNVTDTFSCRGTCQIILSGGVTDLNVIFNVIGPGTEVFIKDPPVVANGIFLAPERNLTLDKATLNGALIGSGILMDQFTVKGGAQLNFCAPCPACV